VHRNGRAVVSENSVLCLQLAATEQHKKEIFKRCCYYKTREVHRLLPSSAEVENGWSCTL